MLKKDFLEEFFGQSFFDYENDPEEGDTYEITPNEDLWFTIYDYFSPEYISNGLDPEEDYFEDFDDFENAGYKQYEPFDWVTTISFVEFGRNSIINLDYFHFKYLLMDYRTRETLLNFLDTIGAWMISSSDSCGNCLSRFKRKHCLWGEWEEQFTHRRGLY